MPKRVGGFINQDGLNAPDQATGVTASAGDAQADVSFTAPADVGGSAITAFRAQSNDGIGASASASPITVTGLTNDIAYTFRVWALNAFGLSSPSDASGSVSPAAPIGLFAGGNSGAVSNVIDFFVFSSAGNATDFGDLTVARLEVAQGQVGSNTRGLFYGGENSGGSKLNTIDFVTFASAGNATDFGDMTSVANQSGTCSNAVRGLRAAGNNSAVQNIIDFVTIASAGNATDFGDTTQAGAGTSGCASPTRGIFASLADGTSNVINFVTIDTAGNATDFGDLTNSTNRRASGGSGTRGVFAGGGNTNVIQYITIASAGNAIDFGDLTIGAEHCSGTSGGGLMLIALGSDGSSKLNTVDQITIASTGNASDFGDLTVARSGSNGASSAHGGLS